jgi:hypothetical protein
MKRDMELVRLILLDIEGETEVDLSPYSQEQINYHQKLLYDRGFIDGIDISSFVGWEIMEPQLTWEGHDFLDDARNENVWRESMTQLGKAVGTASLDVIKAVLTSVATRMITGGNP